MVDSPVCKPVYRSMPRSKTIPFSVIKVKIINLVFEKPRGKLCQNNWINLKYISLSCKEIGE